MKIEAKKYGSNSNIEQIMLIKSRVSFLSDTIIFFKEIPIQTIFTVDLIFDHLELLVSKMNKGYLLVDLTEAKRPNAIVRRKLNERLNSLYSKKKLEHIAFFTGKNKLLNITAKFIMFGVSSSSYSIHKYKKDAINIIENGRK